jgi:hypothetical protein
VLRVVRASDDELAAHERILGVIDKISGGKTVWRKEAIGAARFIDSGELREHAPMPVPA